LLIYGTLKSMRKVAIWLINNIPLGKLAPHVLGYAIGATSWIKADNETDSWFVRWGAYLVKAVAAGWQTASTPIASIDTDKLSNKLIHAAPRAKTKIPLDKSPS